MDLEASGLLESLPAILEASSEAIASINATGDIVGYNSQFQSLLGFSDEDRIHINDFISDFVKQEHNNGKIIDYQASQLTKPDGSTHWVLLKIIPVGKDELGHCTIFIQEPDSVRRIIDRLDYVENFDFTTGFYNRRKGMLEFEQLQQSQHSGGILLLKVTDDLPEKKYSQVLKKLAGHLSVLGQEHIVSRYSVSELLVFFSAEKPLSLDRLHLLVDTLLHDADLTDIPIAIAFSDWVRGALSVHSILDHLIANLSAIDAPGLFEKLREKQRNTSSNSFISALHQALDDNEMVFFIQPQISSQTRQVIGGELLVRWLPKSGNMIPPSEFINFIEEGEFSYSFYTWSIFKAIETLKRIHNELDLWVPLSLNLAPTHINDTTMIEMLVNVVNEHEIPPGMLEVEITERILADNKDNILANLKFISGEGINIAIDDFGTGYSSLSYLRKFPLDRLKIDRVFVANINDNEEDRLIVSSIVSLAHVLGLEVIAEGVEENNQTTFLKDQGCEYFQGFLTGKPMSVDDFIQFVIENPKHSTWTEAPIAYLKEHQLDKSPKTIVWKKSFSTDLVSIDNEHRVLIDVLNNFSESYHNNPDSVDILETLDLIASETIEHFKHEENIMFNIGYPRYKSHKAKHEWLIADITKRRAEFEKNISDINFEEVVKYLKYWLLRHLVSEDTHLRRYLNRDKGDRRD